jgi:hypothetical protein
MEYGVAREAVHGFERAVGLRKCREGEDGAVQGAFTYLH